MSVVVQKVADTARVDEGPWHGRATLLHRGAIFREATVQRAVLLSSKRDLVFAPLLGRFGNGLTSCKDDFFNLVTLIVIFLIIDRGGSLLRLLRLFTDDLGRRRRGSITGRRFDSRLGFGWSDKWLRSNSDDGRSGRGRQRLFGV